MTSQPIPEIPQDLHGRKNMPHGTKRTKLARLLKRHYKTGKSISEISTELGRSYGFVRTLLLEVGTALRPQGQKRRKDKEV